MKMKMKVKMKMKMKSEKSYIVITGEITCIM